MHKEIIRLHLEEGLNCGKIARHMGCSKQNVWYHLKSEGISWETPQQAAQKQVVDVRKRLKSGEVIFSKEVTPTVRKRLRAEGIKFAIGNDKLPFCVECAEPIPSYHTAVICSKCKYARNGGEYHKQYYIKNRKRILKYSKDRCKAIQ